LCSLPAGDDIVGILLRQWIGSDAEQRAASVPTEAVVVAQPAKISSCIGSSAPRIAPRKSVEHADGAFHPALVQTFERVPDFSPLFGGWAQHQSFIGRKS
jgi:hypothetical protein